MPERLTYPEWLARYPERDQEAASASSPPTSRRKVRILLDEDVDGLAEGIRAYGRLRVELRAPKAATDGEVWLQAKRRNLAVVTGNKRHFWREESFPLAQSPGIIALGGNNRSERLKALRHILNESWLLDDVAGHWAAPRYTRIRAVPDGSVVVTEFWDASNDIIVIVDHRRG